MHIIYRIVPYLIPDRISTKIMEILQLTNEQLCIKLTCISYIVSYLISDRAKSHLNSNYGDTTCLIPGDKE